VGLVAGRANRGLLRRDRRLVKIPVKILSLPGGAETLRDPGTSSRSMIQRDNRSWLLGLIFLWGIGRLFGAENLEHRTWVVGGVTREALVSIPANARQGGAVPVVFAFHGHGGTMRQASRSFPIHELWPGAIVVYPQGLPTPSPLVDREGKRPGWQPVAGAEGDRDLKFFDAMLAGLRNDYRIDGTRIYATGHSNGGSFTYLLWAERGDVFAAFAPSSALLGRGFGQPGPRPVLHIGSPQDPLVKFAWQEKMIDAVLRLNGCGPRRPAANGYLSYPSAKGAEVATYLHGGGHRFPAEATALIVKFFQAHARP
jgi:polyhydroxybutyrate depolymerase